MAVTIVAYNSFKTNRDKGEIDLVDDTIKLALCTSSYTPNIDTHEDFADVTNEITGTGYTAGGATLTTKAVTVDTGSDLSKWDADDVVWSTATFTTAKGVLYKSTGTAANDLLIAYVDFDGDQSPSGVDFTVAWNASGIMTTT